MRTISFVPVLAEAASRRESEDAENKCGEARESITGSRLGKPVTAQDSRGERKPLDSK
jgi:hypothetical protein